jgi:hypothetical protein
VRILWTEVPFLIRSDKTGGGGKPQPTAPGNTTEKDGYRETRGKPGEDTHSSQSTPTKEYQDGKERRTTAQ